MKRFWRRTGQEGPTRAQVDELLRDIERIRLTLSSDLSAAAGAIDAEHPGVATEILDADRGELAALLRRSHNRLEPVPQQRVVSSPADRRPVRRRSALLVLPAIPLAGALAMTAAAAMQSTSRSHASVAAPAAAKARSAAGPEAGSTPAATLRQLEAAVTHPHEAATLIALANRLHDQLASLITAAPTSPAQVAEVQRLLSAERHLLQTHPVPGAREALASTVDVARRLLALRPALPLPSSTATSSSPRPHSVLIRPRHHRRDAAPSATPSTSSTSSATPKSSPSGSPSTNPLPQPTGLPGNIF